MHEYDDNDAVEMDLDFIDTSNDEDGVLLQKFSLDYMKQAIDFYDAKDPVTQRRRRSWKSVKHRFRRVIDPSYLCRFRSYIEKQGTRRIKLENINDYVYQKFEEARERFVPVHGLDLHRWASKKAEEQLLPDFLASDKIAVQF